MLAQLVEEQPGDLGIGLALAPRAALGAHFPPSPLPGGSPSPAGARASISPRSRISGPITGRSATSTGPAWVAVESAESAVSEPARVLVREPEEPRHLRIDPRRPAQQRGEIVERPRRLLRRRLEVRRLLPHLAHLDPRALELVPHFGRLHRDFVHGPRELGGGLGAAGHVGADLLRDEEQRAPRRLAGARALEARVERHHAEPLEGLGDARRAGAEPLGARRDQAGPLGGSLDVRALPGDRRRDPLRARARLLERRARPLVRRPQRRVVERRAGRAPPLVAGDPRRAPQHLDPSPPPRCAHGPPPCVLAAPPGSSGRMPRLPSSSACAPPSARTALRRRALGPARRLGLRVERAHVEDGHDLAAPEHAVAAGRAVEDPRGDHGRAGEGHVDAAQVAEHRAVGPGHQPVLAGRVRRRGGDGRADRAYPQHGHHRAVGERDPHDRRPRARHPGEGRERGEPPRDLGGQEAEPVLARSRAHPQQHPPALGALGAFGRASGGLRHRDASLRPRARPEDARLEELVDGLDRVERADRALLDHLVHRARAVDRVEHQLVGAGQPALADGLERVRVHVDDLIEVDGGPPSSRHSSTRRNPSSTSPAMPSPSRADSASGRKDSRVKEKRP